jgi:hypothetical protein
VQDKKRTERMGVEELQAKIESYQRKLDEALDKGDDDAAERYGIEVQKLERKLVKEEAKLPVHPASVPLHFSLVGFCHTLFCWEGTVLMIRLVFGPIAQTVAGMAAISLGKSCPSHPISSHLQLSFTFFSLRVYIV